MLVILPFCARDKSQAVKLAEWISELGGVSKHDCLLAVHKDTDSVGVIEPLKGAFRRIAEFPINDDMIVECEQHAYAANLMWKRVVNHVADMNESQSFLWLEPDATPITADWLDAIDAEYKACKKPFMHDLVVVGGRRSNSGVGVYPAKVRDYTDRLWELSNISWDVLLYEDFAPHTAYAKLIQDVGFLKDEETLPTFPDQASLSMLRSDTAIFHRCKDGTLIDRLREQKSGCAWKPAASTSRVEVSENAGSTPATATPTTQQQSLEERIARLEAAVFRRKEGDEPCNPDASAETQDSAPATQPEEHVGKAAPTSKPAARQTKSTRKKRVRTPEQIAADKERMARVRAQKATAVTA